eukprot:augustus_masked-scaffold_39-processed-gene-2.87-mRNA-1 protein AED:0.02 eAED:0.02 QI:0/-1/0/1/-1/1/1/0/298
MSKEAIDFSNLLPSATRLETIIQSYLDADIPSFDVGGFVVGNEVQTAHLLCKSPGVVSGIPFAKTVFNLLKLEQDWKITDGFICSKEQAIQKHVCCIVKGPVRNILQAERTALNILSRASGVATGARKVKELVLSSNPDWTGTVAGTRKTTPGFGLIEKYSLLVGGVATHRLELTQMTMLKDNHVWSCKSIEKAVKKAKLATGFSSKVEVECRNLDEAVEACESGADIVMLDNYSGKELIKDAKKLKEKFPYVVVEASGGITEETIGEYLDDSVDVISMGKLTQGYSCLDFSLKVQKN